MWTWSITSTAVAALAAPLVLRECTVQIPGLPPLIISEDDDRPTPNTVKRCEPPTYKKFGCRWELWCEDGSPVYARCPKTGERRFIREPHDVHPQLWITASTTCFTGNAQGQSISTSHCPSDSLVWGSALPTLHRWAGLWFPMLKDGCEAKSSPRGPERAIKCGQCNRRHPCASRGKS